MNVGIFGGTFNPPHLGHLVVIDSVQDQQHFERILFTPSASPPHKSDPVLAAAADRLEMTRLAIAESSKFEVSDIEVKRGGRSYTIDTLEAMSLLYPDAQLSLIIGADNFLEFEAWKSVQEIFSRAEVIVMNRQGFSVQPARHEFMRMVKFINVPNIGISSSDIRRRLKLGRSIRYLVPAEVERYIQRKGLYRD